MTNIKKKTPRVVTTEDLDKLGSRLDSKISKIEAKMATKDDLKKFATKDDLKKFATKDDLKKFATKDDLKQQIRLSEDRTSENFDIKLEEKFTKYTDKVTRGLDQVMGELSSIREENTARNARDKRVDQRLDRLEDHMELSKFAD